MKETKPAPEIAEVIRHWMPHASEDRQKAATVNLRGYLAVIYRIACRLEAEETQRVRDKLAHGDTVEAHSHNEL
jgi:hypothetical protein